MNTTTLYAATVLIWGSTWLAINYQLGQVPAELSVVYRFAIASALLFAWCALSLAPVAPSTASRDRQANLMRP